jgi:hypothetical protein
MHELPAAQGSSSAPVARSLRLGTRRNPPQANANPADTIKTALQGYPKMAWFLKSVPYIWLFFTTVIIVGVLHSIYKSGSFN